MHGPIAKALFALALLANLLIGLPVKALAHQSAVPHAVADHGDGGHVHRHDVAAPKELCKASHQQPSSAEVDPCHCQTGLGNPTLAGDGLDWQVIARLGSEHGLPGTEQVAVSRASLPLLRPPRA